MGAEPPGDFSAVAGTMGRRRRGFYAVAVTGPHRPAEFTRSGTWAAVYRPWSEWRRLSSSTSATAWAASS